MPNKKHVKDGVKPHSSGPANDLPVIASASESALSNTEESTKSVNDEQKMKDKGKAKVFNDDKIFICLDDDDDNDIEVDAAIKAFLLKSIPKPDIIDIEACDDDDNDKFRTTTPSEKKQRLAQDDNPNPGPLAQPCVCELCMGTKPRYQFFEIKGCFHLFCCDCLKNYVQSKLDEGVADINCPEPSCFGTLDPEYCKDVLPREVFCQWGRQLCEALILPEQRMYCPFKDCLALFINDGGASVARAECPNCYRLFCVKCSGVWHEGVNCEEYQRLKIDQRVNFDLNA